MSLKAYLDDIRRYEPMDRVQELSVGAEALVQANLKFVVHIAARFQHRGLSLEDLISEGNLGLLEAVRQFDPARGVRFITYAVFWIRRAILRALAEQASAVRVPENQRRLARGIREAEQTLARELRRRPGRDEVGVRMGLSAARVDALMQQGMAAVAFESPHSSDGTVRLLDVLTARREEMPDRALMRRECAARVTPALMALAERERQVLSHRFGLGGEIILSLRDVARRLGLSYEGVRLIERRALLRLRRVINASERRPDGSPRSTRLRPAGGPAAIPGRSPLRSAPGA